MLPVNTEVDEAFLEIPTLHCCGFRLAEEADRRRSRFETTVNWEALWS